ncbi:hypothetical protein FFLO_06263 [Filobasidium floriforme]|uniref:Ammonium transporter n=1 Tax=Filobasidium floriforme TaxID=5210 RepID=A0A8K0NN16_9TREE|nr:hypothetical protein FFLO_06263 [Filobasidium floriforme]
MVNVTYSEVSGDPTYYMADGTPALYNLGDMAWMLTSTALVFIMIPGVGLLYSGLLRRKNALSMLLISFLAIAVGSFQWFFWGYSLAFSEGAASSHFIGDLKYFAFQNVLDQPSGRIPVLLFAIFQNMFACITVALACGGFAERGRLPQICLFMFVWLTIVYCPIACWTWNAEGWSFIMGGLDYAGGTPVHISSGSAALAIALYLGKRRGYGTERLAYKPHNTFFVVLGTAFLWLGWFGFNGGSGLSSNLRAVMALVVTQMSASTGGIVWMLMDWRLERKFSAVGFCSGAIAGLVGITPAAGYVGVASAVAIGAITAIASNLATRLKFVLRIDESLDVFALHGVGGGVGCALTALFGSASIAGLDGSDPIAGGWFDQNWIQLGYQVADSVAGSAYSFVLTTVICWLFHFIPFLRLRSAEEEEIVGIDEYWIGEWTHDYCAVDRELGVSRLDDHAMMVERTESRRSGSEVKAGSPNEKASRNTSVTTNEVTVSPGASAHGLPGGSRVDA